MQGLEAVHKSLGRIEALLTALPVSALKHLGPTHAYAVLGLPDAQQERLLSRADREGWSTRRLEAEARKLRVSDGRGRKPLPPFQKGLNRLIKAIDQATSEPMPDDLFSASSRFGPEDGRQILSQLDQELARLQALRSQIEERIRTADAG